MGEKLPVLIAALAAHTARELYEASRYGRDVWVPLEQRPMQDGPHVLEIHTADSDDPIRLLVEPLGMANEQGTHLRLHPRKTPPEKPRASLAGGRFELLALLGKGSIGAVYQARHTSLNRIVAVKLLHDSFQRDEEFCRRFYSEALAMSRLNHANLISVHDFGQEPDGVLYIAMAYVEGLSLRQLQRRERKFDLPRIVGWMLQVCAGLGHAHARGLIHRDVKPDNLMIVTSEDDDGERVEAVKVLDFGFAVPPSVSGEVAERLAGTPVYMSPEQCRGEELDARTDLYACGVVMYELATGTVPFFHDDQETLREMHVSAPVPLVASTRPDIDPRFERIVQRTLAKNREDRYPSMKELRADLKALLAPEPAVPTLPTPVRSFAPSPMPSSASMAPPPSSPAPDSDPDWLERGSGNYDLISATTTPASALADKLARDASSWLGELSRERNPRAISRKVEELDGAVRVLAERADARTLARVFAVVTGLFDGVRDETARTALTSVARLLSTPDLLGPIATSLLLMENAADPQRDAATKLIAQAGVAGAMALYGARRKLPDARGRVAFVTIMKSLGAAARPVLRAALERIYEQTASGQHRGATELVEDVLLSVPTGEDDHAGRLIMSFVGSPVPSIVRAAARALPRVWGMRARPVLLQLVSHEDDSVCLAAVVGLKELDAIDLEAVSRLAAQINAGRVRSQPLQLAFASALQAPMASAQREAAALLARLRR